jgi:tetratricopeptide (TPR) repeat protein
LLRKFTTEQLTNFPQSRQQAHARHSHFFLSELQRWVKEIKGPQQSTVFSELRIEHTNIIAAWKWATAQGHIEQLLPSIDGLCHYLEWRVRYDEGYSLCNASLEALAPQFSDERGDLILKCRLLAWQARFSRRLGDRDLALLPLAEAQKVIEKLAAAGETSHNERGFIWQTKGRIQASYDRQKASAHYKHSLAYFQKAGANWEAAGVFSALGGIAWNMGEYDIAARYQQQALETFQHLQDPRGIASTSMSLGITLLYQGKFDQAEPYVAEGSLLRRESGDRLGTADSLRNLGLTRMMMGKFDEAVSLYRESVNLYQELGLQYGLEMSMLGTALAHQGNFEQAWQWCQRGLSASRSTGYHRALGHVLLVCGEIALARADNHRARKALEESLSITQGIEQWDEGCRAWVALAYLEMASGNLPQADKALQQARSTILSCQVFIPLLYLIPAMAKWHALGGETQKASDLIQIVTGYPLVSCSHWFKRLLGDLLTENTNTIPAPDAESLWRVIE